MKETLNISSFDIPFCADCKMPITVENNSGWEVFVEGGKTQSICLECNFKRSLTPIIKNKI
jgi:hypothetical protein